MWIEKWRGIDARIQGLVSAGTFYLRTLDSDIYSVDDDLIGNAKRAALELFAFRDAYSSVLPPEARKRLDNFLQSYESRFRVLPQTGASPSPAGFSGVTAVITPLESFRVEFNHLLADADELVRSVAIRSFLHLQRSIVADPVVRERWMAAYKAGETACEKLGACHLLLHGIYAFKAVGAGEQTDLVMNEPLAIDDDIRRASLGLVLTEWKVVRTRAELQAKCAAAYNQASRYDQGILAGFPLASTRYLVMVSEDMMTMPSSITEGSVTYEYRNVAVNPGTPSKQR